ncbi:hypothetical protein FNAPI_3023 [Fusarium napiforme]|uniref:Zn(2)-C6 fungal-type domain-containing protein n=1 Tax=Fusarium napiforme TaxID=42672 RepID=A0A8H5NEX2_9HYPO|nr:hypothetical protein FNAPI_3023 [Fusarium napiforme]
MPGVPKSRGCNSCLKQKKKCDQTKPACSRCARLGIPCVGSGEQKYVFKPVSFTKPFKTSFPKARKRKESSQLSMLHNPQNALTLLRAKLVAVLEITDLRYGLSCYGNFLEHIPGRLGYSQALDTSVDLMMSILPYHYTHEIPSQVQAKYDSGLKVFRDTQDETGTKLSPEDVAAFHIMMICQSWLGQTDDGLKSHYKQVLTRFMVTATEKVWSSTFELKLLETSLVSLFLEDLIDPYIDMEQHANSITSLSRQTTHSPDQDPQIPILRLQRIRKQKAPSESMPSSQKLIHRLQITEAILLAAALALNSILRATYPDDSVLLLEASTLANELIALAKGVSQYRPLGASYIPPCLLVAWATTSALHAQRSEIEVLLTEYQEDYARTKWMDQAKLLKAMHETLPRHLSEPNRQDKVEKSDEDRKLDMLMLKLLVVKPPKLTMSMNVDRKRFELWGEEN